MTKHHATRSQRPSTGPSKQKQNVNFGQENPLVRNLPWGHPSLNMQCIPNLHGTSPVLLSRVSPSLFMFIMDAHLTEAQGPLIPVWLSLATDVFQTRRISGEPMGGGYLRIRLCCFLLVLTSLAMKACFKVFEE